MSVSERRRGCTRVHEQQTCAIAAGCRGRGRRDDVIRAVRTQEGAAYPIRCQSRQPGCTSAGRVSPSLMPLCCSGDSRAPAQSLLLLALAACCERDAGGSPPSVTRCCTTLGRTDEALKRAEFAGAET